jgi:hypothetical protein
MNKNYLLHCGFLLSFIACLSVVYNYQRATTTNPKDVHDITPMQTDSEFDWIAVLSKHPQFKPEEQPVIADEPIMRTGLQNSTLIGVIPDAPVVAIVFSAKSNKVVRVGLGEEWLEDWVLINVESDHVIWQNEKTHEKYLQKLFVNEKKNESLLSSTVIH